MGWEWRMIKSRKKENDFGWCLAAAAARRALTSAVGRTHGHEKKGGKNWSIESAIHGKSGRLFVGNDPYIVEVGRVRLPAASDLFGHFGHVPATARRRRRDATAAAVAAAVAAAADGDDDDAERRRNSVCLVYVSAQVNPLCAPAHFALGAARGTAES